ncbi:MAG: O-antigen acetylase [uncultured Solirubrobacteraceae bacterium]|uniref:O-antigen acetylase n=1 Tax=uncultured Solirubrobacteraceae bacterium TaxID=1162706 RepID=A0A6J4S5Q8_9ACTN|nr:MAG: O-antigen acetylase [uncultured Solirubrobacteraceae bacterium]
MPEPEENRKRSAVRPEIQALRAIAVLTVVIYHVWPEMMPGGFVGVDVFFAISGFLITAHLVREVDRTGTLSLWQFWARRARRLLPAALLTLFVCAVGTIALVPQLYWQQFLTEIGTSTAYVQNWQLASDAVDYLGADNRPSPVQHFWSLSAEEQFYVIWPLLILVAAWTARRRLAIAFVLLTVTGLSLWYSISETASNPAAAYFVTPTRAWEFGAGGLLALLGTRAVLPDRARALLSWAGLGAVGYAAAAYSTDTAFPGWAAVVPIAGALAVIHAGMPAARWAPSRILQIRPAQFLGDISYSVYLWHWPLLVFTPFVFANPSPTATRIAVPLLTIALAWVTKVLVEDPVRRSAWLSAQPRMTFACSAAATAVLAAVLLGGTSHVEAQIRAAEREQVKVVAQTPDCFGAAARDPQNPCENEDLRTKVVPLPVAAKREANAPCPNFRKESGVSVCDFGVAPEQAQKTVALLGDSHASHWRAPLDIVARERGWRGLSVTRTSCVFSAATKLTPEPTKSQCLRWVANVPRFFRRHPEIDTVFIVAITGGRVNVPRGRTMFEAKMNGVRKAWETLPETVKHIVVIRDTPRITRSTVECIDRAIAARKRAGLACAVRRKAALEEDPAVTAARKEHSPRVQAVDLSEVFCGERLCYPVIGGALVYKDLHHFTRVFAETLGPLLGRKVAGLMQEWSQRP